MTLYYAGRLDDAQLQLERLGQDFPEYAAVPLALVSARSGDRADAQRLLDRLASVEGPRSREVSLRLAYLAEAVGDKDQAVSFLREYFAETGFENSHHLRAVSSRLRPV